MIEMPHFLWVMVTDEVSRTLHRVRIQDRWYSDMLVLWTPCVRMKGMREDTDAIRRLQEQDMRVSSRGGWTLLRLILKRRKSE